MRNSTYTILAFLLLSSTRLIADEPDEKLHQKCLYPTVRVTTESGENYGSGVIVRSIKMSEKEYLNVFLTAAHVMSNDPYGIFYVRVFEYEDWSTLRSSTGYRAAFYDSNAWLDIAIGMFISDEKLPVAEINMHAKVYIGSEVLRIGVGASDSPRLDYGKITWVKSQPNGKTEHWLYRTSIFCVPGDSGGGLYNNYKLIGILQSIRVTHGSPLHAISYFNPVISLQKWSDDENGAYEFVWKERACPKVVYWKLRLYNDYEITKLD